MPLFYNLVSLTLKSHSKDDDKQATLNMEQYQAYHGYNILASFKIYFKAFGGMKILANQIMWVSKRNVLFYYCA